MAKDCRSGDGESLRQAFAISVLKWSYKNEQQETAKHNFNMTIVNLVMALSINLLFCQ